MERHKLPLLNHDDLTAYFDSFDRPRASRRWIRKVRKLFAWKSVARRYVEQGTGLSMNRPWNLFVVVFLAALVSCTTNRTEPPSTTAPVVATDEVAEGFPIEFLEGVPLPSPSGLVLFSGDSIVDVDAGSARRIEGLPVDEDLVLWNLATGGGAVLMVDCQVDCGEPELFSVDAVSGVARSIARGFPSPALDGVWVKRYLSETTCTLSKVGLDGTALVAERRFDCDIALGEETPMGLVVSTTDGGLEQDAILDPETWEPVFETGNIIAVVENQVLSWEGGSFTVVDRLTGAEDEIASPTDVGEPSNAGTSPDGRFLAITFQHPAWPGPRQRLDVWMLEIATLAWTRVPSMPVAAALKATDETWAADGRFVIFGSFDEAGHAVATWRPGDQDLATRQLDAVPSGSLVVWTTTTP